MRWLSRAAWLALLLAPARARDAQYEKALSGHAATDHDPIPNIVHFTHGLRDGFAPYFHFYEYLSVASAAIAMKPDKIILWCHNEPTGPWFEKARPFLEIRSIEGVTSVFGRPIAKFAHRSDVLRLWVLHEYGGIYLDIDVIALKPFTPLLQGNSFVLGREGKGEGSIGLCNAIILSKPRAPFLRKWMQSYETFDGIDWNWHSVRLPSFLAKIYPKEVTILDYDALFWPLWDPDGLQRMYMDKSYDFAHNYAVHLWESNAKDWFLNQLTPELIRTLDLPFYCLLRRFLDPPEDPSIDPGCQVKENVFGNGLVAAWDFDKDDGVKVIDSMPNMLHGWAINGTYLTNAADAIHEAARPGEKARWLGGQGDFIVLPTPANMTFHEVSLELDISREEACTIISSVAALQTEKLVVLIEGACNSPNEHILWLKVFGFRDPSEWNKIEVKWHGQAILKFGQWNRVQVSASASSGRIRMWVNGILVASGPWPPEELMEDEYLRQVWLGARPASPFPDPLRNSVNDYKGWFGSVSLFDHGLPKSDNWRAEFASPTGQEPRSATFRIDRDGTLLHQSGSFEHANIQETAVETIKVQSVVPWRSKLWSIHWTLEPNLSNIGSGADQRLMSVHLSADRFLHIGVHGSHGQITIDISRAMGIEGAARFHGSVKAACSAHSAQGLQLRYHLELDAVSQKLSLFCDDDHPLFSRHIHDASLSPETHITLAETGGHRISSLSVEARDVVAATVMDDMIEVDSIGAVDGVIAHDFSRDRLIDADSWNDLPVAVDPEHAATIHTQVVNRSPQAFFLGVPAVTAKSDDRGGLRVSLAGTRCGGQDEMNIELHLPEISTRAYFRLRCDVTLPEAVIGQPDMLGDDPLLLDLRPPRVSRSAMDWTASFLGVVVAIYWSMTHGRAMFAPAPGSPKTSPPTLASSGLMAMLLLYAVLRAAYPARPPLHPASRASQRHQVLSHDGRPSPVVSVITPCYQQAGWIEDAADSLLQQTYPHWEWIIVIDGSKDNCSAVARSLKERPEFKVPIRIIEKANSGLAHSRNVGIGAAMGDYIACLDADDRYDATYLERAMDVIAKDPTITAVAAYQQFFGDSNWQWEVPDNHPEHILYIGTNPTQTIFRREDWRRVGGFEPTMVWGNEDWSFWISLTYLPGWKQHVIPEYLCFYRYKAVSMQRTKEAFVEVVPMMMTLHPTKYTRDELLLAHDMIKVHAGKPTKALVEELSSLFPNRRPPFFWKGLFAEARGHYDDAASWYRKSIARDKNDPPDWQPRYRLDRLLAGQLDFPELEHEL